MKRVIYAGCLLIAACSGGTKGPVDPQTVVYEYNASDPGAALGDVFSSVTILPLETTQASLVSSDYRMFIHRGDYYLVDTANPGTRKTVVRFDSRGRFMGTIGTAGRADNEYPHITDAYPTDEGIEIYSRSYPDGGTIWSYSTDGKFIARKPLGFSAYRVAPAQGGGYWVYMNYDNGVMPERVVRVDEAGEVVGKYLPSEAKVMGVSEWEPVFIPDGEGVLLRESLSDRIVAIDPEGGVSDRYVFDFGHYTVPESYFEHPDMMAAAMALFGSDFANLAVFFESRRHSVLQVAYQFGATGGEMNRGAAVTGFRNADGWRWVKSGTEQSPTVLSMSLRALVDDDVLVLLVDNYKTREFAADNPGLVRNAGVLDGMDDDAANPSILLCKLK